VGQRRTVYTPGHGVVTDALIMHGVVRALAHMGIYDAWVERVGERYRIEFAGRPRRLVETDIGEALLRSANLYIKDNTPTGPLKKLFDVNPKLSDFREWVADLAQAVNLADIMDLTEDHRRRRGEGRSERRAYPPLYLLLGPEFGNYRQRDFAVEGGVYYRFCDTCFTLANIGLMYGAAALVAREGGRTDVTLMSLAPSFRSSAADILLVQRVAEGYKLAGRAVPTLAAPMYWLSVSETLYDGADFDLIVWHLAKIGNFVKVLDVATLPAGRLMEFVAEVRLREKSWPEVAERVMQHAPEALAKLAEVVLYGGDVYHTVKELAATECNGAPCFGGALRAVAEVLAGLKN